MGLFFVKTTTVPVLALRQTLREALITPPGNVPDPDQRAEALATQVQQQVASEFSWSRFWAAVIFLLLIFGLGVATAYLEKVQMFSTPCG